MANDRLAEHGFSSLRRSAEHGFSLSKRSAEHGFTLIEMMVALAVFGLAALALLRLQGAIVKQAANIEIRTMGQIVTNNLMVDAVTDPVPPPLGTTKGTVRNGGRNWHWTRTAARTADANIIRIDINVIDDVGNAGGSLSIARPER